MLRPIEQLDFRSDSLRTFPRDADWRQILAPAISPEKILQTV